jgi:hypothetical protein
LEDGFYRSKSSKEEFKNSNNDFFLVSGDTILFCSTLSGGTKGLYYGTLKKNKIKPLCVQNKKRGDIEINSITKKNTNRSVLIVSNVYQGFDKVKDTLAQRCLYDGHVIFYDSIGRAIGQQRLDTGFFFNGKRKIIIPNDEYSIYSMHVLKEIPISQFNFSNAKIHIYENGYMDGSCRYVNKAGASYYQTEDIFIQIGQIIDININFYPSINYFDLTNSKIEYLREGIFRIYFPKEYIKFKHNIISYKKFLFFRKKQKYWEDFEIVGANEMEKSFLDFFDFMLKQL